MFHVVSCDVVHACCLAAPVFLRFSVDSPRPHFMVGSWQNLKGIYEELNKDGKVLEVEYKGKKDLLKRQKRPYYMLNKDGKVLEGEPYDVWFNFI